MVSGDSADVWARQDEFRLDASVGVPPDAFSDTGQDWGLPVYRWDVFAERDFDWLRHRARRNADLFDGYRVDHLVGFYRTYFRPHDGGDAGVHAARRSVAAGARRAGAGRVPRARAPKSSPRISASFPTSCATRWRGSACRATRCFAGSGTGTSPGQPFKDPVDYPPVAVATSGTHDTEPMAIWWEQASRGGRAGGAGDSVGARSSRADDARRAVEQPGSVVTRLREALLESLYASGADLLILPMQDVFGWRDRINQPATVGDDNWTWRLPWPVRSAWRPSRRRSPWRDQLREWSERHGR